MASKRIANGENVRTLPTYLHLQKVSGFCSSAIVLPNLFCSFLESCFIPRDFKSKFFREILAYSLVEDFFLSFCFSLLIHFSSYILYPNYTRAGKSCQIKKKLPQSSFFFWEYPNLSLSIPPLKVLYAPTIAERHRDVNKCTHNLRILKKCTCAQKKNPYARGHTDSLRLFTCACPAASACRCTSALRQAHRLQLVQTLRVQHVPPRRSSQAALPP